MARVFKKTSEGGYTVKGVCPHPSCQKEVFECIVTLDDCYGLNFTCPHCGSILFLDMLKGYSSQEMHLDLPVDEELAPNNFPLGTPTQQNPYKGRFTKVVA